MEQKITTLNDKIVETILKLLANNRTEVFAFGCLTVADLTDNTAD